MAITSSQMTEIVLIIGSLVAIAVGIFGRKNKGGTEFKTVIRALSGIMGIILLGWTFLMVFEGTWDIIVLLMILALGIGLLLPLLPKFNIGTLLALIIALIAGFAVESMGGWAIIVVFLIVFFILWFVFRLIFGAVRLVGAALGSRWVLLVLGVIGIFVVVYGMI